MNEVQRQDPDAAGEVGFFRTYAAVAQSVGQARAEVAHYATRAGVPQAPIKDVKLAVSEAVTNVVAHAYRDPEHPGAVEVHAALEAGELLLTVTDTGSGLRARPDSPGLGLGLAIIAQLAHLELLPGTAGGISLLMRFAADPPEPGRQVPPPGNAKPL